MKTIILALTMAVSLTSAAQATNTVSTKQKIVQGVLDLKQLKRILHSDLVVSDKLIGSDLKLTKSGKQVAIVPDKDAAGSYLRFTVFECKTNPTYCNIVFEYPIKKVVGSTGVAIGKDGSVKFEKTDVSRR